jgi:hypothetical protein
MTTPAAVPAAIAAGIVPQSASPVTTTLAVAQALSAAVTQDVLYSFFLTRCSEYRIRKPNRWVLALLEDFSRDLTAQNERAKREQDATAAAAAAPAASLRAPGVATRDLVAEAAIAGDSGRPGPDAAAPIASAADIEVEPPEALPYPRAKHELAPGAAAAARRANALLTPAVTRVPLAERTSLVVPRDVVLGNATLMILVELMHFMPRVALVDISSCRLFDSDPLKLAPAGNDVIRALMRWAAQHPAVEHIDLGAELNPIGTEAASWIAAAATENPRLADVAFDERGVERHTLADIERTLRLNRSAQSPLSTAIRSIHEVSPEIFERMRSMQAHGSIDRKTSEERQLLLTLLYDRAPLFHTLLESGAAQTEFVAPARQWLLSEVSHLTRGVRGDGAHLFIVAAGSVTVRLGSFDVRLQRGDVFGEDCADGTLFAAGLVVRRSAHGLIYTVPHEVCRRALYPAWEQRVRRFLPIVRACPMLSALPVYLLVRCCYDAQLVAVGPGSAPSAAAGAGSWRRVLRCGDRFGGLLIVTRGALRVRQHRHVARFMQGREEARSQREQSAVPDFEAGGLLGEEALVNRRGASTVDVDCVDVPAPSGTDSGAAAAGAGASATAPAVGCELLQLDVTLCATVLLPLLRPVLLVQARAYGAEWTGGDDAASSAAPAAP